MKFVMLAIPFAVTVCLYGCVANRGSVNRPPVQKDGLPYGVSKFSDGDTTCYLYYEDSISCVRSK